MIADWKWGMNICKRFKAQDQCGRLRELLAALAEIIFPGLDELDFK